MLLNILLSKIKQKCLYILSMDNLEIKVLKEMCMTPSPSNNEELFSDYVMGMDFKNFTKFRAHDESITIESKTNMNKTVLLDAHIDQVHLRVVKVSVSGELIVKSVGFDMDILLGNKVIHMKSGLKGVIGSFPPHLRLGIGPNDKRIGYCDMGMSYEKISEIVEPGDVILFDMNFSILGDSKVIAPGLDNKINGFNLYEIMKYFDNNMDELKYNLIVHFSTREEIGLGSFSSNLDKKIDYIIVMDSSPSSDQVGIPNKLIGDIDLGNGPVLTRNYEDNYKLGLKIREIGKNIGIFPQIVFSSGYGASNSKTYSKLFNSMVQYIGTPIRYIHSPFEMVDLNDVRLVKELIINVLKTDM